jgi:hypothetical protein
VPAEYAASGWNGEKGCTETLPFTVRANALAELSTKRLDWQVRSEVPEMAVRGAVGGVNAAVYTAAFLTIRRLEMLPGQELPDIWPVLVPIVDVPDDVPRFPDTVPENLDTPLTKHLTVPDCRVRAM